MAQLEILCAATKTWPSQINKYGKKKKTKNLSTGGTSHMFGVTEKETSLPASSKIRSLPLEYDKAALNRPKSFKASGFSEKSLLV